MQRVLALIGVTVFVVLLVWSLGSSPDERSDGSFDGDVPADPDAQPTLEAQPPLVVPEVVEQPAKAPEGPGAIRGRVVRGTTPTQARIEIRNLAGALTGKRSLARPFYAAGPPLAAMESGEDGRFLITNLPLGAYEVRALAPDGAIGWERAYCHPGTLVGDCYIGLIEGSEVLEARATYADGRPFRGYVSVSAGGGFRYSYLPEVETRETGDFRVIGIPKGPFRLRFFVPDVFSSWFTDLEAPLAPGRVFVIDAGLETRSGRVIEDKTEVPIPGASIVYDSGSSGARRYTSETTSADDGTFQLTLPGATASLYVRAAGFATVQAPAQEGKPLVVRMKRVGHVHGRVVEEESGSPVPGAPVHAWNWHTYDTKSPLCVSDADGRFEADVGPGKGMIYVLGAGWVSATLSQMTERGVNTTYLEAGQGETVETVVEVVRAGSVEGIVLDAEGEPVAGMAVAIEHPPRWQGFRTTWLHGDLVATVTASDGRFDIGHLIPGFTYTVVTRPVEGLPARSEPFTAVAGETTRIEIRPGEARWLTVRVIDKATRQPISGVTLSAVQQPRHSVGGMTGADGTFRLGPLLPAPLYLTVRHAEYLPPSGASGPAFRRGQQLADPGPAPEVRVIELEAGGFMAGVVLGVDGEPVTKGYLGVYPVGKSATRGLGLMGLMQMQKTGAFRVGPVASGTYDLVLVEQAEGLRYKEISRWTTKTGAEGLRLVVDPSLTEKDEDQVVFRVLGPDGKPASGHASVYGRARTYIGTSWVREGRVVVTGAEPGAVAWVEIRGPKNAAGKPLGGVVHGPVKLEPGVHDIQLSAAPEITGRVLDQDGKPVAGLLVRTMLILPDELSSFASTFAVPAARTDKAGSFKLASGAAGARLVMELPAKYALATAVEVPPGSREVEIRLAEGQELDVSVLTEEGAPIPGARAIASLAHTPIKRSAATDERGVARIKGLEPGATYRLDILPPQGSTDFADETLEAWSASSTSITLPAGGRIEGRVLQGKGPLGWATVWWKDRRGQWRKAQADNAGRFAFTAATGGPVALIAGQPSAASRDTAGPAIEVEPPARDVVLKVPK
ncbi:MAG: carboxypeptidase regulatory-like domain-containing protein [Planctomycetota bacterium]|nr:carboxypeptidase regulatory-like domain-containing protein [Planctomycetota bacterium]